MRRFPFNPFTTEAEKLQALDKRLRDQDAAEKLAKATDRTGSYPRRLTVAQARSLRDESKAVQDVIRGTTFHRPTQAYVWCDHHGAIHAATFDIYGEGDGVTSECSLANWRSVFIESTDPKEDFG